MTVQPKEVVIVVDFGASHVKAAAAFIDVESRTLTIGHVKSSPSVPPLTNAAGCFEVSALRLKEQFEQITNEISVAVGPQHTISAVALSCEMHGFMIAKSGQEPLSPYISWKDERACDVIDHMSTLEALSNAVGEKLLHEMTGLRLKPGLAIVNFLHLRRLNRVPRLPWKILSLGDWLISSSEAFPEKSHASLSGGMGFHSLDHQKLIPVLARLTQTNEQSFIPPSSRNQIAGSIQLVNHGHVPAFSAVGDLGAAILGISQNSENVAYFNLGTGSQVVAECDLVPPYNATVEVRNGAKENFLRTITHIPSGRALQIYSEHFATQFPSVHFWNLVDHLTPQEIISARDLELDLCLFKSAWGFRGKTTPDPIPAGFEARKYAANLLHSYCLQYKRALELVSPRATSIQLSGGIPQKTQALNEAFEGILGLRVMPAKQIPETLVGLARAANRSLHGTSDLQLLAVENE